MTQPNKKTALTQAQLELTKLFTAPQAQASAEAANAQVKTQYHFTTADFAGDAQAAATKIAHNHYQAQHQQLQASATSFCQTLTGFYAQKNSPEESGSLSFISPAKLNLGLTFYGRVAQTYEYSKNYMEQLERGELGEVTQPYNCEIRLKKDGYHYIYTPLERVSFGDVVRVEYQLSQFNDEVFSPLAPEPLTTEEMAKADAEFLTRRRRQVYDYAENKPLIDQFSLRYRQWLEQLEITSADHTPDGSIATLNKTDNLVYKALELFGKRVEFFAHVGEFRQFALVLMQLLTPVMHTVKKVHVDKYVPAQAGMGGGSANAGAVISWLAQVLKAEFAHFVGRDDLGNWKFFSRFVTDKLDYLDYKDMTVANWVELLIDDAVRTSLSMTGADCAFFGLDRGAFAFGVGDEFVFPQDHTIPAFDKECQEYASSIKDFNYFIPELRGTKSWQEFDHGMFYGYKNYAENPNRKLQDEVTNCPFYLIVKARQPVPTSQAFSLLKEYPLPNFSHLEERYGKQWDSSSLYYLNRVFKKHYNDLYNQASLKKWNFCFPRCADTKSLKRPSPDLLVQYHLNSNFPNVFSQIYQQAGVLTGEHEFAQEFFPPLVMTGSGSCFYVRLDTWDNLVEFVNAHKHLLDQVWFTVCTGYDSSVPRYSPELVDLCQRLHKLYPKNSISQLYSSIEHTNLHNGFPKL